MSIKPEIAHLHGIGLIPLTGRPLTRREHSSRAPAAVATPAAARRHAGQRPTPRIYYSPGWYAYNASYSLGLRGRPASSIRGLACRGTACRYDPEGGVRCVTPGLDRPWPPRPVNGCETRAPAAQARERGRSHVPGMSCHDRSPSRPGGQARGRTAERGGQRRSRISPAQPGPAGRRAPGRRWRSCRRRGSWPGPPVPGRTRLAPVTWCSGRALSQDNRSPSLITRPGNRPAGPRNGPSR